MVHGDQAEAQAQAVEGEAGVPQTAPGMGRRLVVVGVEATRGTITCLDSLIADSSFVRGILCVRLFDTVLEPMGSVEQSRSR